MELKRTVPYYDVRTVAAVVAVLLLSCSSVVQGGDIVHHDDKTPRRPGCDNNFVLVRHDFFFHKKFPTLHIYFLFLLCFFELLRRWFVPWMVFNVLAFRGSIKVPTLSPPLYIFFPYFFFKKINLQILDVVKAMSGIW